MELARIWGGRRYLTLAVVLALHVCLVTLMWDSSRDEMAMPAGGSSLVLITLPPPVYPRVRTETAPPASLRPDTFVAQAPPEINAPYSTAPSSTSEGHGSGINWTAEAHRAILAFEIRRDQPLSAAMSVSTFLDDWWPSQGHRVGERFKTENGDWIVWISADCYEVASWHEGAPAQDHPATFCNRANVDNANSGGDTRARPQTRE